VRGTSAAQYWGDQNSELCNFRPKVAIEHSSTHMTKSAGWEFKYTTTFASSFSLSEQIGGVTSYHLHNVSQEGARPAVLSCSSLAADGELSPSLVPRIPVEISAQERQPC
jgi:hypothetical protein